MQTQPLDLTGATGARLSAQLDLPDGAPLAYVLLAHCFTCSMRSLGSVHIARALAARGLAVVRFDFAGLGESAGTFADTSFSGDVADLKAVAAQMAARGTPIRLLVGHSIGGAAVLAAAGDLPDVAAVATIGAPFKAEHLTEMFKGGLDEILAKGEAEVMLGGRPFTVRRSFVDDLRAQDQGARIEALHRPLLILHSPQDAVVGVDNASQIFMAARHPKSFVCLDHADHLLTRAKDSEYAAEVIAAWASRYLAAAQAEPASPAAERGWVEIAETGAGKFQVEVRAGTARILVDEPPEVGGQGSGPTPYEMLSAGLGACTAMTLRLYAGQKGWPLQRVKVRVAHVKTPVGMAAAGAGAGTAAKGDLFTREIALEGALDEAQKARLLEIAARCPVHRSLETGSQVETRPWDTPAPAADRDEHMRDVEAACVDCG